jgi:hypothetical protein
MAKFRKKPAVIDAVLYDGTKESIVAVDELIGNREDASFHKFVDDKLVIFTLEGNHEARAGDWIIKGVRGEFYPCKPDIFADTYEEMT